MAFEFTAEDGTGVEGANAYITVAEADAYHEGRATAAWIAVTVTAGHKEAAIVKATDHLETTYGARFKGTPLTDDQGLHWPASGAFVNGVELEGVPEQIKRACAEYAVRALSASLAPDSTGGVVASESETGGGLSYAVTYSSPGGSPSFPTADRWLAPILYPPQAVRF